MKQKLLPLLLALSLLLSGCGWMDGSYVQISEHQEKVPEVKDQNMTASSYAELENVLAQMVRGGKTEGLIYLTDYVENMAESGMYVVSRWLTTRDPVGAYAVENVTYEVGSNSGKPAIAVSIHYKHTPMEIQQIEYVKDNKAAEKVLGAALENLKNGTTLCIREYEDADFIQMVTDYAQTHPQTIMEIPHVTEAIYGDDESRVVELSFAYRSNRDALKQMRSQVEPVFEAARLYVSEDAPPLQQYSQLYSFLMERFDYRIQSSITPSYSLLHHGVGDSSAFALVYQAMCRSIGLECKTITGTRSGEPWTWNMITLGNHYGHVDLLQSQSVGGLHVLNATEMQSYVWDYSASPGKNEGEDPGKVPETQAPTETAPGETTPAEETAAPTEEN